MSTDPSHPPLIITHTGQEPGPPITQPKSSRYLPIVEAAKTHAPDWIQVSLKGVNYQGARGYCYKNGCETKKRGDVMWVRLRPQ